jgi:hypothetical protein
MRKSILVGIGALLLVGCTMELRPTATPLVYVPDRMELVGKVYGEAKWGRFLFIIPGGDDEKFSTYKATEQALRDSPGRADAILNPTVEVQTESFLGGLWEEQTVRVSGEGIRFKTPPDSGDHGNPVPEPSDDDIKKAARQIKQRSFEGKP